MEVTALSVCKTVLNQALGYSKSAIAEELALQLGVQSDQAFIRDELEMMQSFLMAVHEDVDKHMVIKTWVKQVRDVSYDVEDCLQDFIVRMENASWWCIPRMLLDRHHAAKQMKELRAKVEDVSQRNVRYCLMKDFTSKADNTADKSSLTYAATMSGIEEARKQQERTKLDLVQLICRMDEDLRVIAVWGTSVLGVTSIMKRAFDDPMVQKKFQCYAWIEMMHPFDLKEFVQGIMRQFYINSLQGVGEILYKANQGAQFLQKMGKTKVDDLAQDFKEYVNDKSYMILITGLSTMEEWDQIKKCFQNSKNGSRIIVCTEHAEVASLLCAGQESGVPVHRQLSSDQTIYAFYQKGSRDGTNLTESGCSSNGATTSSGGSATRKLLTRMETMVAAFTESQLIGRDSEKFDVLKRILHEDSRQLEVISICGMGGVGKTSLVKDVYQSQVLTGRFQLACVTITRPFDHEEILMRIVSQLDPTSGNMNGMDSISSKIASLLERRRHLIVLDDLLSTDEWDTLRVYFPATETASRIIVTTRLETVARHCSNKQENIYNLRPLGDKDACDLFTEKVFGRTTDLEKQYPDLVEQAKLILKKCSGLPLAIVTIGGFLANQRKTLTEWRKLNEHIGAELELNPELGMITTVLIKSYEGLPYNIKSCFLYLSIFPEDHIISRKRLVRRWTAEGYSRDFHGKSAEEVADSYFMELIDRSMILAHRGSFGITQGIDSCKVHDMMREITISKSMDENLVLRMGNDFKVNSQAITRHLVIGSNWEGDQLEFESTVDLSHIRSLTVFGMWKSFFLSAKMRFLRVLDLEGTSGLVSHHIEEIGMFIHLKFLSLRGCGNIYHLPDSLGNLRQLQTLIIRGTSILMLPKTIIKLRMLRHIDAGGYFGFAHQVGYEEKRIQLLDIWKELYLSCCAPQRYGIDEFNRRDACTEAFYVKIPGTFMDLDQSGVMLPRGIRKLKDLQTLRFVHLAWGNCILEDIEGLTRLQKLGVAGINKGNGPRLCLAICSLRKLESLLIEADGEPGLKDCLDDMPFPPENLESLKIQGILVRLPEWVGKLHHLVKLKLRNTRLLDHDAAVHILGNLPKLALLRLWWNTFQTDKLHFQREGFTSLLILEVAEKWGIGQIKFEDGAMPKLELLYIKYYSGMEEVGFSGLELLPSIKEVRLNVLIKPGVFYAHEVDRVRAEKVAKLEEDLQAQVARNPNQPFLKME